ncbi:hypothetical protein GGX14DRAFT_573941 [Mycena pura]|uniref:Uncharacterized protein n=1 Tax=Mycena pura TaxID=153505 RepID=A0AAD6UY56_9AGAR|nr:hypothetical protein GGX14DRAFT_573941 [Mycena pura]
MHAHRLVFNARRCQHPPTPRAAALHCLTHAPMSVYRLVFDALHCRPVNAPLRMRVPVLNAPRRLPAPPPAHAPLSMCGLVLDAHRCRRLPPPTRAHGSVGFFSTSHAAAAIRRPTPPPCTACAHFLERARACFRCPPPPLPCTCSTSKRRLGKRLIRRMEEAQVVG